jgi:hypothetical protein
VTSIGYSAFRGCTGLTHITIPNSVKSIGDYAFRGCTGLTQVTIPGSVESIGDYAFQWCSLTQVTIPGSVKSIGACAFSYCTSLTHITIPDSVESIGACAFSYCTSLTQVTIPNSVKSIGNGVFCNCFGLTQVTIPNSVKSIGNHTFSGCTDLTHITIPDSVKNISPHAFDNCSSLQVIAIEDKDDKEYHRLVSLLPPAQQQLARRWSELKAAETIKQKALTSVAALSMNGLTAHLLFKLLTQNGRYKRIEVGTAPLFCALNDARYPALSGHNVVVSTFRPHANLPDQMLPRLCSKLASRFCLYPAVAQISLPSSPEEFESLFTRVTETAMPYSRGKLLLQPPKSNPESDENAETDNSRTRCLKRARISNQI